MSRSPRLAVAISAFRSDRQAIQLIDQIVQEQWPVDDIIVVESLGTGGLARYIETQKPAAPIRYVNAPFNLGSAGNLQKRLELATQLGAEFVLALNHDAAISRGMFDAMLTWTQLERLGALYPLRYRRGKRLFDLTGASELGIRARGPSAVPAQPLVDVRWSSSNGALYSTAPLRDHGLKPDGTLWMGWEDYLYGLQLHRHGYRQCIVTAARTVDEYEYRKVRIGGRALTLFDKPTWYLYYSVRNRLSIDLHRLPSVRRAATSMVWAGMMFAHVAGRRVAGGDVPPLSAYCNGVIDGLLNRGGKWQYPL